MIVPFLAVIIFHLGRVDANLQWSHNTTKEASHNACCNCKVGTVTWMESNANDGIVTNMMDFSFDFPPSGQPMNPVIEAWWCRDYTKCNDAQSIYRAFLSRLSEYQVKQDGSLGTLATANYGTWKVSSQTDSISGSIVTCLNMSTVDQVFSLYAFYSPNATDYSKSIYIPKNGRKLSPKMVKFGIQVNAWDFANESNVMVLDAAFGSKGTLASYKYVAGEIQLVVEAVYGENVNFTLKWEETAVFDGITEKPVTILGVSDQVYSSVQFKFGDGKFKSMDWDPSIGLSVQLTGQDSTTITAKTTTATGPSNTPLLPAGSNRLSPFPLLF